MATEAEILTYIRQLGRSSQLMQDVTDKLQRYDQLRARVDDTEGKAISEYKKSLDNMAIWNKESNNHIKQTLMLYKAQQAAHKKKIEQDLQDYAEAVNMSKDLRKQQQKAIAAGDLAGMNAARAARREVLARQQDYADLRKQHRKYTQAIAENEAELRTFRGADFRKNLIENAGKVLVSGIGRIFAGITLANAIAQTSDALKKGTNTGASVGVGDLTTVAGKLGMSPGEYIELQAAHRQATLAAGGLGKTLGILTGAQEDYLKTVWNMKDRTKAAYEQLTIFTNAGVRPLIGDVQSLAGHFEMFQKMTGQGVEEYNRHISEMISDESTQLRLKAANTAQERRAIVEGTAAQFKQNIALGMTTEQAKSAAKALNAIAGKSPLERFKEAAKMRAFGAAMGIAGTDDAARIMIKGRRASPEEQGQLQQVLSNMSDSLSQSATGSMGGEIFATTLADKLGLDQLIGENGPLNMRLAKDIAPKLSDINDNMKQVPDWLKKIHATMESVLSSIKNNPIVGGAVGGAVGTAGFVGKSLLEGGIEGYVIKKLMERGGAGALGGAASGAAGGGAASGIGSLAKYGKLAKFGGPAAGALIGGGIEAAQGNYGAAGGTVAGTAIGGLIGSFIPVPVVGTMVGAAIGGFVGDKIGGLLDKKDDSSHQMTSEQMTARINKGMENVNKTNDLLTKIHANSEKHIELAEKQLVAMTMSKEESSAGMAGKLRKGTKFYANYTGLTA